MGLDHEEKQFINDLPKSKVVPRITAAPVPPAGDVEVLAWIISDEDGTIDATVRWDVAKHSFGHITPIVSQAAHQAEVTRLTAERDEEALWRKEAREGWGQATKVIEMQRVKLDEQEAELTKARELLNEAAGKLYVDTQLKLRINAFNARQPAHNVDERCGQDAEAAKGERP